MTDETDSWWERSACGPQDNHLFFSDVRADQLAAKVICGMCPVREPCLSFAVVERLEYGIYGGATTSERDRRYTEMRRNTRRQCLECFKLYTPASPWVKYCSELCRRIANNKARARLRKQETA